MFVLPEELRLLLAFLITQGIKSFLGLFGKDLAGKLAAVIAVVVFGILATFEGVIGSLPPETQTIALQAAQLILGVLALFGVHKTYKGLANK